MIKGKNCVYALLCIGSLALMPTVALAAAPPGIPDGWSDGYVYANGIRIHYYHAVPAPGKPVIVMCHGVTDNGLCFTTLTWKLQKSYDVYMLDTRGHGLSDPFQPNDGHDTLVKDVVDAVHALKLEKPILLGHSMGAATVMRVGAEYPELARAIIMLDPLLPVPGQRGFRPGDPRPQAGGPPPPPPNRFAAPDHLSISMFGSPETLVAQNNYPYADLVAACHRENPKWNMVDCDYWALSKKQYHGAYTPAAWSAMSGAMDIGDSLGKITVPALILKADAPPAGRKATEQYARVMQHGKLVYIDGAAHNLHHDQLARTVKEIDQFLAPMR